MEALAVRAVQGDENAFNELYHLTRDRAYFVAYSITHNEQDALDILQESYLKAWQKCGSLQTPAVFGAWLNQIVGNTAKDFVKKRRPLLFEALDNDTDILALQPEENDAYIPHEAMDTSETKRLIMDIIGELPEDQRLCILLYYYDDLPVAAIADALELPLSTVKNRLAYARKKISSGVEQLEKSGKVKLYGAAPISLMTWLLRNIVVETNKRLPPVILGSTATATGTTTAVSLITGITLPKIVAGVTADVIAVSGSVIAAQRFPGERPLQEAIAATTVFETVPKATTLFAFPTQPPIAELAIEPPAEPALTEAIAQHLTANHIVTMPTQTTQPFVYVPQATTAAPPITTVTPLATTIALVTTAAPVTTTRHVYSAPSNITRATTTTASTITTAPTQPSVLPPQVTITVPIATTMAPITTVSTITTPATTAFITTTSATTASTTTTPVTTVPATTAPTTTTPTTSNEIILSSNGVTLRYGPSVLPPSPTTALHVGGSGFTTVIVDSGGTFLQEFRIVVTAYDAPVQPNGYVTFYLPIPANALGMSNMDVLHRVGPGVFASMGAWREGNYLVFTTNHI